MALVWYGLVQFGPVFRKYRGITLTDITSLLHQNFPRDARQRKRSPLFHFVLSPGPRILFYAIDTDIFINLLEPEFYI
jgi:hypothetical protein